MLEVSPNLLAEAFPGLIAAYRFDAVGRGVRLDDGEARALVTAGVESGWVWAHFSLSDVRASEWLLHESPLPAPVRAALVSTDDHLRLDMVDGALLGVLADLRREIDREQEDLGRLRLAMTERLVISARRSPLGSVDRARAQIDAGSRLPMPADLLRTVAEQFCEAVSDILQRASDSLDDIEDRLLIDRLGDDRLKLGPIRYTGVRLHRQVVALRRVFLRLAHSATAPIAGLDAVADHAAHRLDALDHEIIAVQDRARLLQDEIGAKLVAESNRHLFVISMLTAFLMPPTLVVGVFGMNTRDLPFADTPGGFWWAMLLAAVAGGIVYGLLRRVGALR